MVTARDFGAKRREFGACSELWLETNLSISKAWILVVRKVNTDRVRKICARDRACFQKGWIVTNGDFLFAWHRITMETGDLLDSG